MLIEKFIFIFIHSILIYLLYLYANCMFDLHANIMIMFKYTKDRVSVLTVLDTRKAKADGAFPVKVQVCYNRMQKYYSTGKSMSVEEWDKLPNTKNRNLINIRESIENSFDIVKGVVEELVSNAEFSYDSLNSRLKRATNDTLKTGFLAKIADLREENRIGSMLYYENILKGVERFGGDKARIDCITVDWLKRYEKFLLSENKNRTTIGMHMRGIRVILNDALRSGNIKNSQYPFGRGKFEIQAGEGRKMALTLEQIGQIAHYEDGSNATAKYRDYWLFLYFCNGINVADFVKLKYKDIVDSEICFIRQKTERTTKILKEIRAILTQPMQEIINKWGNAYNPNNYIFPILDGKEDALKLKKKTTYLTRAINKRMAEIGTQLGLGNISTYTARHSFATILKRSGANIAFISESLGHNDLKTTENYLSSFEKEERQKNADLLTKF